MENHPPTTDKAPTIPLSQRLWAQVSSTYASNVSMSVTRADVDVLKRTGAAVPVSPAIIDFYLWITSQRHSEATLGRGISETICFLPSSVWQRYRSSQGDLNIAGSFTKRPTLTHLHIAMPVFIRDAWYLILVAYASDALDATPSQLEQGPRTRIIILDPTQNGAAKSLSEDELATPLRELLKSCSPTLRVHGNVIDAAVVNFRSDVRVSYRIAHQLTGPFSPRSRYAETTKT